MAATASSARYATQTLPLGVASTPGRPGLRAATTRQTFAVMPLAPLDGQVCNGDAVLHMFTADDVEKVACHGCRNCTPTAKPVIRRGDFDRLPVPMDDDAF